MDQLVRGRRPTADPDFPAPMAGDTGPARRPRQKRRKGRRSSLLRGVKLCTFLTLPLVLMAALALTLGYVRLTHGPISLKFIVPPIERGLAAELGGSQVAIEDAVVRLTDAGRLEFRLSNVRLSDKDGQPVATAPLAAVELALSALWQGRIAPARIELIDPRLLLVYSEETGLALSFARLAEEEPAAPSGQSSPANNSGLPDALQRIDIARTLAESSARARRGSGATSFLHEFGLRNATVFVQQADGGNTSWRIPELVVDVEHKQKRSIISGKATIVSGRAPWSLVFRTEESEKSQTIEVNAGIRELVPRTLSRALPQFGLLDGFELPVGGNVNFELSRSGDIISGNVAMELSRGRVQLPWLPDVTFPVDAGLVDLRYHRDRGRIEIAPSTLRWGQSHITLVGHLMSQRTSGGEGVAFDIRAIDGAIAAEEFGIRQIPLETWTASGQATPQRRHFELNRFEMKAGGAEISLSGVVDAPTDNADASFEGRIGPMPLATLKAVWPRALAPGARGGVGERVTRGRVTGGSFRWLAGRYLEKQPASPHIPEQRLSLAIEASDVSLKPLRAMAPIEVPRVLVRLEGGSVEIGMPDAHMALSGNRRIPLRGGRLTAIDIFGDVPIGEIVFRVQAPLAPVLEAIDQEPLNLVKQSGIAGEGFDGKVDGQVKISLPLINNVDKNDVKVEGKVRVTEGRGRKVVGGYDVQAANIAIDFADTTAEATGDLLVAGVPAKLGWQRTVDAAGSKSSQVKLTTKLDNSDRVQLGFDVNHIIQGEIPVELTATPVGKDEPQVIVKADLTGAELLIDNIAWKKAPGSKADLQFEIIRDKGRTELSDFRIRGDNITADGVVVIGADNHLREFNFRNVTLNLVSQFEMSGVVRPDNVLDVKVRGRHFEGREFFRSLFSLGQIAAKPVPPQKTRAGLDLNAEIDTIAGFSDVALRGVKVRLAKRADRLVALDARGTLDGGKPLAVVLANAANEPRRMRADSTDAGQAMRLIGFYPNLQGGRMRLEINLDGKGDAEKTGVLRVDDFRVLGDPVLSEVISSSDGGGSGGRQHQKQQMVRQATDFDRMYVPFSVGYGQFVVEDSYLKGALVGLSVRGKVDYKSGRMDLGGTYVPLQGLNNMLGGFPVLGQILSGPRGEGIFGITFAVQGAMSQPQVIVNPLSVVTPGILRGLMEMTNPDPRITPREDAKAGGEPKLRSAGPEKGQTSPGAPGKRSVQPEVIGGWTSETNVQQKKKAVP